MASAEPLPWPRACPLKLRQTQLSLSAKRQLPFSPVSERSPPSCGCWVDQEKNLRGPQHLQLLQLPQTCPDHLDLGFSCYACNLQCAQLLSR